MKIELQLDGGQEDELRQLESVLREEPDLKGARIVRSAGAVPKGALGVETVLLFVGTNVLLPLVLQAVYDHLVRRRRTRSGQTLRATVVRTDLPDGTRRVELAFEGPSDVVVEAARRELE